MKRYRKTWTMEYNSPTRIMQYYFWKNNLLSKKCKMNILNFLVNFIFNILIKCILIKKARNLLKWEHRRRRINTRILLSFTDVICVIVSLITFWLFIDGQLVLMGSSYLPSAEITLIRTLQTGWYELYYIFILVHIALIFNLILIKHFTLTNEFYI